MDTSTSSCRRATSTNNLTMRRKSRSDLFLGQPDGTFVQAAEAAGIVDFARGRGAAMADLNLDGRPDLIEVFYGDPVQLWRNDGPAASVSVPPAHWLDVRPTQPGPNRDGRLGAWLEVQVGLLTLRREVTIGGGHESGQLGWQHFGLGPASGARVRVQWPDGEVGPWLDAPADGFELLDRATGRLTPFEPTP